jgi:hypothetical protein
MWTNFRAIKIKFAPPVAGLVIFRTKYGFFAPTQSWCESRFFAIAGARVALVARKQVFRIPHV